MEENLCFGPSMLIYGLHTRSLLDLKAMGH